MDLKTISATLAVLASGVLGTCDEKPATEVTPTKPAAPEVKGEMACGEGACGEGKCGGKAHEAHADDKAPAPEGTAHEHALEAGEGVPGVDGKAPDPAPDGDAKETP